MDTPPSEPAQTYLQLRKRIISLDPAEVGLVPSSTVQHVWGVLMDTGYEVGIATLVSLADGTTSLYFSTGGGMLGSGDFAPVSEASKAMVIEAEKCLIEMIAAVEFPLPALGRVRFSCLTFSGIYCAEADEVILRSGKHPLSNLYLLAHETLEQLRLSAEKKHK